AGIASANVGAAQAYIADVTDRRSRLAGMGLVGVATGIGAILGPAMAAALLPLGPRVPFFAAAVLAFGNFLVAVPTLVEPTRSTTRQSRAAAPASGDRPRWMLWMLLPILAALAMSNVLGTFPIVLDRELGLDQQDLAWLYAYWGAITALTQGVVLPF